MTKNTRQIEGSDPNDKDRIETYLDDNQLEEERPWHARGTDHRKSRSKAKRGNNSRRSARGTLGDEITGDSDLE